MTQQNGSGPLPGSAQRMALDNLIRRELKVSDPNDPAQIAQALLTRYQKDPRAVAISREAQGVPFLLTASAPMPPTAMESPSQTEWHQAITDVNRDLQELTDNAILKDIKPELDGWAMAIRSAIAEGINSARFAIDSRQRDKTFGIRRTLGDYARIARLIGALTPVLTLNYRKLAQSLDEVSAVLLVMMGEAISNIGFNSGRYLLQVAFSDLQARRDAVIYALRNLVGSTQESYGPDDWQRGLNAYRQLYNYLERFAQGDLRSLLVENELSRVMDNLLQRAGQGSGEGLRQLGATFQVDIERLRRLVIVGHKAVKPAAPPFTAFLDALQLFVDSVQPAGGSRLIRIARPPILFYGLYGQAVTNRSASQNLLQLVIQRGILADQLDRFAQGGLDADRVKGGVLLDKILCGVDRAIDLYSVGTRDTFSEPDFRAAAYSYLVDVVVNPTAREMFEGEDDPDGDRVGPERGLAIPPFAQFNALMRQLRRRPEFDPIELTLDRLRAILFRPFLAEDAELAVDQDEPLQPAPEDYQALIQQELFIQSDTERGWANLVEAMAPAFVPYDQLFGDRGVVDQMMAAAIARASITEEDAFTAIEPKIPAHEAFSLARLVSNTRLIIEEIDDEDEPPDGTSFSTARGGNIIPDGDMV